MRLTKAEKSVFARLGRKGGKNRATKLSPERRAEIARMGGLAKAQNRKVS